MASSIIYATRSTADTQPGIRRIIELAGQTFLNGTPVQIDAATGAVRAWDGTTVTAGIAGFTKEPGANLTTTGVPKTLTYPPPPPYQPLAVNIPAGAPINDGRNGFEIATDSTIFYGQVGPAQTAVAADVGAAYGLTIDTDGHWYVDKTKTGATSVVKVVKLAQFDTRGVQFVVMTPAQQQVF